MKSSMKAKALFALLCDGRPLSKADQAALSLYNLQRGPLIPPSETPSISDLPIENFHDAALSVLLFALQRKDEVLIKRAATIAKKFGIEHTPKAILLLDASVGSQVAMLDALKTYFTVPAIIDQVKELLQPQNFVYLSGVDPNRYRHPDDVAETNKLKQRHGFETLVRYLSKNISERAQAIQNAGNAIAVGPNQLPDLFKRYQRTAKRLGVHPLPPLYLNQGAANAYTSGVEEPFIVISKGMLDTLNASELDFVLGHELGHVQFDHVLYQLIARMGMAQGFILSPTALIGRLISSGIALNIAKWSRMAELSCDRAGLLACQNEKAAFTTLLRFAGAPANRLEDLNIDAFLAQHNALENAKAGALGSALSGLSRSHPWITQRVKALKDWIDNGNYRDILRSGKQFTDEETPQKPYLITLKSLLLWADLDPKMAHDLIGSDTHETQRIWSNLKAINIDTLERISDLKMQQAIALDDFEKEIKSASTALKGKYKTWFHEMTEDDRRHKASTKLKNEMNDVILKSLSPQLSRLAYAWSSNTAPELHLSKNGQALSAASLAAGLGQLGFGALLLPAAPVWMLIAGVGIGAASAATDKKQQKKATVDKLAMHIEEVDKWIDSVVLDTLSTLTDRVENHVSELKKIKANGWHKSISEIRDQIKANESLTG